MNEVTNKNYNHTYDEVAQILENAAFVAVDSEFTGLKSNDNLKLSLFDTNEDRYKKLKETIEPFVIVQFGITALERVRDQNEYKARSFNFYLLPRSIPIKNRQFLWQVSALEFLSSNNFDFNKVAHSGISYVNEEEEAILQQQLQNNTLFENVERMMTYSEESMIKDCTNKIEEWLNNSEVKEDIFTIETSSPTLQYLMQKELRKCFPSVWTMSNNESVMVIKVTKDVKEIMTEKDQNSLEKTLLESYIGFSRIFKLLVKLKKPIVGHNILLDLMFMYKLFYKPLPNKYKEFKTTIHRLFPVIYDTKYINYEIKELFQREDQWSLSSLSTLYHYFKDGRGKSLSPYLPQVTLIGEDKTNLKVAHHAGWDSYFTGFLFINAAYVCAANKYGAKNKLKYYTNTEVMSSVKEYANCVNITRAQSSYLKFDGSDPESTRPQWLFVKTVQPAVLNINQIVKKLSSFGSVDVKPFSSRRLLVAVATHGSARDILKHFRSNKELYVAPYSPIRHSPKVKFALWSSIFLTGGMFAWMVHRSMQKSVV